LSQSAPTSSPSAQTRPSAGFHRAGLPAQSNFIHTGSIEIGTNAFVGEASVLDIGTAMGNDTQLGHASSLQTGRRIPDGKRYHGSPAQETRSDYCPIENVPCSGLRRGLFEAIRFSALFAIAIRSPSCCWLTGSITPPGSRARLRQRRGADIGHAAALRRLLSLSGGGLLAVYVVPRVCQVFLETDKTYSLYGIHYRLQTIVARFSNSRFFNLLFGDSSAIVHYMPVSGWKPEHGGADRLELRHQPAARQPVPLRHWQRNDGLRTGCP
jgi:non-ribosomal peptide synthetase-like protein